ncbi:uncharacterized protein EI90DRAFT_3156946 [Cantharellus anzutake]|uniref:uncharacterized protein n=1 Tax=Cantharellus anzutake TaxID=1750568 RepID=UPI00190341DD|nr:uncharacterized protein EI90DRAFT_3156946 [Cantharellus anzutake]KAF8325395.1 hypothetical protein EI90DRAFT_3156946 [Cantharellus anzutake]
MLDYTITTTRQGYKAAYDERLHKYGRSTGASALFANNVDGHDEKGVRIEAPEILKEFVDGVAFGKDPVGTLFYYNIDDINGKTRYNVIHSDSSVEKDDVAVIVQFFGNVDNQGNFYAEFVGRDPARTVKHLVDGTKHKGGSWHSLKLTKATALVQKKIWETEIKITIASIDKQTSFRLPAGVSAGNIISVWGNLSINRINKIGNGTKSVVDYNNDRILFYPDNLHPPFHPKDLTAVFIPFKAKDSDANALGKDEKFIPIEAKASDAGGLRLVTAWRNQDKHDDD